MSLKVVLPGLVAAAVLGWVAAERLRLPLRAESAPPIAASTPSAPIGPVDLTPPYVGPQSLAAARALDAPAEVVSDVSGIVPDGRLRRELAQLELDLRASSAELKRYENAAALVSAAASAVSAAGEAPAPGSSALAGAAAQPISDRSAPSTF